MPTVNLKEYADTRKVSYDAVRKQIQRYRDTVFIICDGRL